MSEAKRPSATIHKLADLISRNAGIVAPLLKLANSPFIGLRSKVTSVANAVNVMGTENTLNLVQNIALRQSLGGGKQSFEKFWERSSISAYVAARVAARLPHISRDDAYIATLFEWLRVIGFEGGYAGLFE